MNAAIFDTETTGITEPALVEAAYLEIESPLRLMEPISEFGGRFNPGKRIEFGAMATHHIMPEDVRNSPPASEFKLPTVEYLIGHNVDYDWKIIGSPDIKRICTLALFRHFHPTVDTHQLGAALYFYEGAAARDYLRNAHSASGDVANCRIILGHLVAEMGNPPTWDQVWQVSEVARIPTIMSFGKHKGVAVKDVPSDYKRWLLAQPDVDPYLAKALRA